MRDNGDGLSVGTRLGKPIQGWDLGAKVLSFVDDTSNSFVFNRLREIGGGYKPLLTGQNKNRSLALGSE